MKRSWSLVLLVALLLAVMLPFGVTVAQDGPAFQQGVVTSRSGEIAVRAEPDISSETLGTLANDTVVDVWEVGDQWTLISSGDLQGYVFSANLRISPKFLNLSATASTRSDLAIRVDQDIASDVVDVVSSGDTLGVIYVDGLWAYVYTGEAVGWTFFRNLALGADSFDAINFLTDVAVADTRNEMAVRSDDTINSDLAFVVSPDEEVYVLYHNDSGLFAYILYNGQLGWALTSDLAVVHPRAYASGVTTELRVNFRSAASAGSADTIISQLPLGAALLLTGRTEDGSWLGVRYEGQEGWVRAEFVDAGDFDLTTLPVTG